MSQSKIHDLKTKLKTKIDELKIEEASVEIEKKDGYTVFRISGEVTSWSEKELERTIGVSVKKGIPAVLDFNKASYVNSGGMAIIISILTIARGSKAAMTCFGLTDHFEKIFDMVGIIKYMKHYPTEREAIDGLSTSELLEKR